jgi:hypothetical protein
VKLFSLYHKKDQNAANSIVANIYSNNGLAGLITAKIVFNLILIFASFLFYWNSNGKSFWVVNGFLISLTLFGAIGSVLRVTTGYRRYNS